MVGQKNEKAPVRFCYVRRMTHGPKTGMINQRLSSGASLSFRIRLERKLMAPIIDTNAADNNAGI